jgi:hypothetical protein
MLAPVRILRLRAGHAGQAEGDALDQVAHWTANFVTHVSTFN